METPLSKIDLPHLFNDNCLNGQNYIEWTQFIKLTFKGMVRLNHIEGNVISHDDPNF